MTLIEQAIFDVISKHTLLESEGNLQEETLAYAGSRVDYDTPSLSAIGSGEGAQVHGWGLYYAINSKTADNYYKTFNKQTPAHFTYNDSYIPSYLEYEIDEDFMNDQTIEAIQKACYNSTQENIKDNLKANLEKVKTKLKASDKQEKDRIDRAINIIDQMDINKFQLVKPQLHEVSIPELLYFLDEQRPYSQQYDYVQDKLDEISKSLACKPDFKDTIRFKDGRAIYKFLSVILGGSDKWASEYLEEHGIPGITYFGQQDGRCVVIFNPKTVKILSKKY